jgi:hypothetical protein
MRRDEKKISEEEALEILDKAEYGVLSTVSETGEPYGVPLNHCLIERNIYFHSATEGHKVDNIEGEPRVSFCTIGEASIIPDEFSTAFESAIAFGSASEVFDQEKRAALEALLEKYSPDFFSKGLKYMKGKLDETRVFKISISRITGKSSK